MGSRGHNKKIFTQLVDLVSESLSHEDFVPHPVYPTGWEPENQAYEASLIKKDFSQGVEQFEISFCPRDKTFRFSLLKSGKLAGFDKLEDLTITAHEWTDCWLYKPYTEYLLIARSSWIPFSSYSEYRVAKSQQSDPESASAVIYERFIKNIPFLLSAVKGEYVGRRVSVSNYHIKKP